MDYLAHDDLTLERGTTGWLTVTLADGTVHEEVHCRRLFPMTDPDRFISLHRKVEGDHLEIGIIHDLMTWPREVRELVEQALLDGHFLPEIERIEAIAHRFGMQEWSVITGRGPKAFSVVKIKENVVERADGSIVVTDMEKCRYRISEPMKLTPRERRLLLRALP